MAIIPATAVTEAQINQAILAWLETREDADRWRDFYVGSTSRTIIEAVSGVASFLRYQAWAARREASPLTAKLDTSIRAAAYLVGYPVNRRKAARLNITVTNNSGSDATLNLGRTVIGTIEGRKVSVIKSVESQSVANSSTATIECAVGEWKQASSDTVTYEDFSEFGFTIDDDVIYVDNELLEIRNGESLYVFNTSNTPVTGTWTRYIEDMDRGIVCVKTGISSIVVTFGSDEFGQRIESTSVSADYLQIIPRTSGDAPVEYSIGSFTAENNVLPEGFEATGLELVTREIPEDDSEKIARILPGYFASRRRMVTPADHEALINSIGGIHDSKFSPGICQRLVSISSDTFERIADGGTLANNQWRINTQRTEIQVQVATENTTLSGLTSVDSLFIDNSEFMVSSQSYSDPIHTITVTKEDSSLPIVGSTSTISIVDGDSPEAEEYKIFHPTSRSCNSATPSGNWIRAGDIKCVNVMSYIRGTGDSYDVSEPVSGTNHRIDITPADTDMFELDMMSFVRKHQIVGADLDFRYGVPVYLDIRVLVTVNQAVDQVYEDAIRRYIRFQVEKQCFKLGGSFNPAQLTSDIKDHPSIRDCWLSRPYEFRSLSWLGFFYPRTDRIQIIQTQDIDSNTSWFMNLDENNMPTTNDGYSLT